MKYYFALILTTIVTLPIYSQSKIEPTIEAHFTAIIVKDIDSSIVWYSNNLGFKVLDQVNFEDIGLKQANLENRNIKIELIQSNKTLYAEDILKNQPKKTLIAGFFKFGFLVSDFTGMIKQLEINNVNFHGRIVQDENSGKKMVIIKDPDGNRIQLFEK